MINVTHCRSSRRFERESMGAFLALVLGALSLCVSSAFGGTGDIAIYREALGNDLLDPGGASMTHDWDTTVRTEPASYSLVGGTGVVCKAGHYLVLYSSRFDDPNTGNGERSEVNTRLLVNGTSAAIGWSQGYVRRNNNDHELITAGGGIIMIDNDDDAVALFSERTDAEARDLQRIPDASAIQLVKLDDSWDYCRLSRMNDRAGPGTSFADITYDTQDELDTASFAHNPSGGNITLKTAGHYMVLANTHIRGTHASRRCGYVQRLTLDGNQIAGSRTTVYIRGDPNSDNCYDGAVTAAMIIETTADNQVLSVECMKEDTDAGANVIGGRTAVTIARLPDSGEYIRLDDSGTDNFNPGTTPMPLGWDTELEMDACFTHNDSQIGVTVGDDYLFFCTLYDDDDSAARLQWWQRWRKNGTDIYPYGTSGRYSRNANDGSGTNHKNGNRSAIVVDLVAGDYVETVSEQLANGGTLSADVKGLQGVRLSSILNPPDPAAPVVANAAAGATSILDTSATPQGELVSTGGYATALWVYYGTNDGLDVGTNWDTNVYFGADMAEGPYGTNVTGLTPNTTYYYRFRASNATGEVWAANMKTFKTLGPPTVTHDGGADPLVAGVTLRGELTDGTSADATIYWGRTDGGTNHTDWTYTNAMGQVAEGAVFGESQGRVLHEISIANAAPGLPGSVTPVGDGWAVTGSGNDIWGAADDFHFAYVTLTGDFDVHCRASDFTGGTDGWRKGGLMARESLTTGSRNTFIARSPVTGQNRITFQNRLADGAASVSTHQNGFVDAHYWLRLVRLGDRFSGYWAPDAGGAPGAWTQMGADATVGMSAQIYVGFAVTAHNDAQLTTVTFDKLNGITFEEDEFLYGVGYYYRTHATNAYGEDWSDASEFFTTLPPAGIGLANDAVTDMTPSSATFNGALQATGSVFDVSVYWGTSDGGAAPGAWGHTNVIGSYTNVGQVDLSYAATGLISGVEYFYAFGAANAATNMWGTPSERFTAIVAPTVDNSTGAVVRMADATLRGELVTGGAGDVTVYWGTSDGSTNHLAWDHTNTLGQVMQGTFETDTGGEAFYGLTYYYRCYVTNALGEDWSDAEVFESIQPRRGIVESGTVVAGDTWTTVNLDYNYESAIVVCSVNYSAITVPVVPRVRNVGLNSFEVKLQNPGDLAAVVAYNVHYLVMEEGTNQLPDGRNIEAHRVLSDGVSEDGDWTVAQQEQVSLGHTYTRPVVLGQVMTHNDAKWSVFWSNDGAGNPASGAACYVGKHVGSDTNLARAAETLGVIVVEAGDGDIMGVPYDAGLGGATVQGIGNAPPYYYTLSAFSTAPQVGVVCQTDMNGADGGWAYLYGSMPLTATNIALSTDEDQIGDAERGHAAEPVFYWVFGSALVYGQDLKLVNTSPTAVSSNEATFHADAFIPQSAYDITVYWGTSDAGTNAGGWANTNTLGSFADGSPLDVSFTATGLTARTNYYYTFFASNQFESFWAAPSMSFSTLREPTVTNAPASDVAVRRATMNGELLAGGSADVTIYWGMMDGGTNKMAWDYSSAAGVVIDGPLSAATTNPALYGVRYYYRCYATNAFGDDWADAATEFTTPTPGGVGGLPVTDGLLYHLDAALGVTKDAGDNVSLWEDQSVVDNDFSQGTANKQPLWIASSINNLPVLQFDGADEELILNSSTAPETFFAVTRVLTGGGLRGIWGNEDGDKGVRLNDNSWYRSQGHGADNNDFNAGVAGYARVNGAVDAGYTVGVPHIIAENRGAGHTGNYPYDNTSIGEYFANNRDYHGDVAEVIVYDSVLSSNDHDQVGGYLAWKYNIASAYPVYAPPSALGIDNAVVSGVSTSAATCNGVLYATGSVFAVHVYWGTSDGGTNAAAWANTNFMGSYADAPATNVSLQIDELLPGTVYYYTFRSSNMAETNWASPSESFITVGQPTVSNAPATDVTDSVATLNGSLNGTYSADVTVYWGLSDGGTNAGAWSNATDVGTTLLGVFSTTQTVWAGGEYYYRCYATNSVGDDWADTSDTFTTRLAGVSIGDVTVTEKDGATVDAVFAVTIPGPSVSNITVNYVSANGTAIAGSDYVATTGVVGILSGQTSTQVVVTVNGDTEYENPPETFSVQLSSPVACTIVDDRGTGTIIDDDLTEHLGNYGNHMRINIDGYAGGETLTNFPVLLRLSETIPEFDYDSFSVAGGGDLLFTDGTQTIPLNHEIESWDTGGESCVWAKVPELPAGGTHIWAFWGNANAGANTLAPRTWSAGFEGVWHMTEASAQDSTPHARHGTASGLPTLTNGQINGSVNFVEANGDFVTVTGYKGVVGAAARTVSAWIKTTDGDAAVMSWGVNTAGQKWTFRVQTANGTNGAIRVEVNGGFHVGMTPIHDDQWHYVAATFADDGTPNVQDIVLYVDGVTNGTSISQSQAINTASSADVRIGQDFNNRPFNGPIDEARISSVVRSEDWIKACYDNQKQGSTFLNVTDVFVRKGTLLLVR